MFSKSLKQISSLSFSTTGSRILGLIRDAAFFSSFGNSVFSSAFIMAFTIPNLFRRLLGEGALASAFLPVFAQENKQGKSHAMVLLNQTLTRLFLYFGSAILVTILILAGISKWVTLPESWTITIPMTQLLLPYALIICMAAILTAGLNCLGKFFIPSFSPVLLNLSMIGSLIIGSLVLHQSADRLAYTLCFGVLLGGSLQLLLPALQMFRNGWKPRMDYSLSEPLQLVRTLFLTATGGAAIVQVNVLVTRLIAYQLSDDAVSQLYMASRLTELPLGVFSVAIYTVLFPMLARFVAESDPIRFSQTCRNGTIMMLGITVPSAIGLSMLSEPILSVLFEWGKYSAKDVLETAPILSIYAISIPLYSLIAYFTRIFHSKQNMQTPVKVSLAALVINIVLSIGLMVPFGVKGLAWANVCTSFVQFLLLSFFLVLQNHDLGIKLLISPVMKITGASVVMTAFILWISGIVDLGTIHGNRVSMILELFLVMSCATMLYFFSAWILGLKRYLLH
jgi:putative peptidoglycan lipid II flippase